MVVWFVGWVLVAVFGVLSGVVGLRSAERRLRTPAAGAATAQAAPVIVAPAPVLPTGGFAAGGRHRR